MIILTFFACDKAQLPQIAGLAAPLPRLPLSATLQFDETVQTARLETEACGEPWQGHLGHALATGILKTSRQSFARVQSTSASGAEGATEAASSDLVIRLTLQDHSFERATAFGGEDNYTARLHVELMAVIADPQGKPIGKTPLRYDERLNIWTPAISGSSGACPTGQLEGAMDRAADELARQMVAAVATWVAGTRIGTGQPVASATPVPGQGFPGAPSALIVKASLMDENDNLILEGGEKIGVRIDVTNNGQVPIPAATVSLSGTSTVIDAFASAAAGALDIGPMQPGETKSTLIWGKMPDTLEAQRAELVVSVVAAGASSSQTLVAAIRPRGGEGAAPGAAGSSVPGPAAETSARSALVSPNADRHAVLINLTTYRTPWAEADAARSEEFPHLVRVLRTAGGLSRNQMLVLADRHATRADLEEGLLKWLPAKLTPGSVVLVYISTQAVTDGKSGEIYLIPYEGSPNTPQRSLVSLPALQGTLKRLNAKLCLLLIDAPVAARTGTKNRPDWRGLIDPSPGSSIRLIQIVAADGSLRLDRMLVLALDGQADANQDKQVTLGELLDYLKVGAHIYPTLPPSAPERSIPITG